LFGWRHVTVDRIIDLGAFKQKACPAKIEKAKVGPQLPIRKHEPGGKFDFDESCPFDEVTIEKQINSPRGTEPQREGNPIARAPDCSHCALSIALNLSLDVFICPTQSEETFENPYLTNGPNSGNKVRA
jgi:hypothetical protein